ncbi:hypothetical protein Ae201684P_003872 [Aphanomyces euteiches]|uniref:t-SNARE coiled-coil homology domain-containing protein n=1 Tax=Aphanomyces euteiches TaxID=100861 RepID=A0A6G0XUB1_9STRA|nr:hypothetical protein Ae201684_001632 [Aphanomyces euteiches]KAH9075188.1 hypothetical protein Ae201684P_003872 [Aphanomyces euteiches]
MAVFHFFGEIQSVPQPPLPIEMPGRSDYIKPDDEESLMNDRQLQQREMNKQDEDLDLLSQSVKKLGVMSSNISTELDYQNRKLDEINAETDRAQENLDIITKKTRELIKEAGGMKNLCIIIGLSLLLIILTYLVIMT